VKLAATLKLAQYREITLNELEMHDTKKLFGVCVCQPVPRGDATHEPTYQWIAFGEKV
jgi:hypothetical protein